MLGAYPSHRYSRSWIVQRLFNNLPEWALARVSPVDFGQQLLNPIALEIQNTYQQLAMARYNQFLSTADLQQLDCLYRLDLTTGMEFQYTEDSSGIKKYIPPSVYATIDGTEYQITQAEDNNIKTLSYDNLPSRLEDGSTSYTYQEVISETTIANLSSVTPNSITIEGHLYITLKDNTNWEERTSDKIYYPKIYLTGTTRKGTKITEAIPLRYNGTFKTINEWQEIDSIFVSYLDDTATICVETFPQNRESYLDHFNIDVPVIGDERMQFTRLNTRTFGSTFLTESFTVANMDIVRNGIDEKEIVYEIELLNNASANVDLVDFVHRHNTRFIYAIDNTNLYVYDVTLPFPNILNFKEESEDAQIDLVSSKWILTRGATATIQTHNLNNFNPPWRVRWSVLDPNGNKFYLGVDGSFWPTTIDAWIDNDQWEDKLWREQKISFTVDTIGSYIVSLEADYYNETTNTSNTLTTKFLFYIPSIAPEIQIPLPSSLQNSTKINFDSDNNLWLYKYGNEYLLNMYFDYFIVDYENNRVYMKEEYPSVRITV